jgi:hypothetical protein
MKSHSLFVAFAFVAFALGGQPAQADTAKVFGTAQVKVLSSDEARAVSGKGADQTIVAQHLGQFSGHSDLAARGAVAGPLPQIGQLGGLRARIDGAPAAPTGVLPSLPVGAPAPMRDLGRASTPLPQIGPIGAMPMLHR